MMIAGDSIGIQTKLVGGTDLLSVREVWITMTVDYAEQTRVFVPPEVRASSIYECPPGTVPVKEEEYRRLLQTEQDLKELQERMALVQKVEIPDSFGDGLKRDSGYSSYNRPCGNPACKRKIHHTNRAGICTDCYMSGYRLPVSALPLNEGLAT